MTRPPLDPLCAETLSQAHGIFHGFFSRRGGHSAGLYRDLNCGLGSNDDPEAVAANRARVARHLHVAPGNLLTLYQVHSPEAVIVDSPWPQRAAPRADAMITTRPGLALSILTADCAPVLFWDAKAGVVAAAHAGWKGALTGIIAATVEAMVDAGAARSAIQAAIGPCITQENYEVGPEFKDRFCARDPGFERYFTPSAAPGHAHARFDLPAFVADRLADAGIRSVEKCIRCTYREADDYFSYRRSTHRREPDYGRNISAIALSP